MCEARTVAAIICSLEQHCNYWYCPEVLVINDYYECIIQLFLFTTVVCCTIHSANCLQVYYSRFQNFHEFQASWIFQTCYLVNCVMNIIQLYRTRGIVYIAIDMGLVVGNIVMKYNTKFYMVGLMPRSPPNLDSFFLQEQDKVQETL